MPARPLLHRVFNTCVENFTEPKHCNWTSAEFLLILRHQNSSSIFDQHKMQVIQFLPGNLHD